MGCSGSVHTAEGPRAAKTSDVCITCTNPVQSSEDFAAFFGVWIMKTCAELRLSCTNGRPLLGARDARPGSREEQALRAAVLGCRVVVCIVNIPPTGPWPPPGYSSELAWAAENFIPVVPFYDGDRYSWKEVCKWKVDLPALFRSGLGPIMYHRKQHEQAKVQLSEALKRGLKVSRKAAAAAVGDGGESSDAESIGPPLRMDELSLAERKLMRGEKPPERPKEEAEDGMLGLQRSDFERAGLVRRQLERTNSLRDINVETALALLAKRSAVRQESSPEAAGREDLGDDVLAAREGGCRLEFLPGFGPDNQTFLLRGPCHRVLRPVKGILKKKQDKREPREPLKVRQAEREEFVMDKRLRLAPVDTEERRHAFAVQQLQQHLDSLQADDVHEFMTIQRCLQDGVKELGLVLRALRLIKAFLELHLSLHPRAIQQGLVPALVAAMRAHTDVDVAVTCSASLAALLQGAAEAAGTEASEEAGGSAVDSAAKSGAPEVVSNAMRTFPACEMLQEHGCRSFGFMCQTSEDNKVSAGYKKGKKQESNIMLRSQARRLVARYGGVAVALVAMQKFPSNGRLQAGGCMVLGRISGANLHEHHRRNKDGGGVIGAVVAALARHPRDREVQRWGCSALRHFSSNSQENKSFIAKRGGVEVLCTAVRQFRTADGFVVSAALGTLCHLASKHPANKQLIYEAGAMDLVIAALGGKPEAELAIAGCGLLHNLACDEALKREIVKLGGRELAERLVASDAQAVRNLARVLQRTLAPPQEATDDPFGSIFATRTPGAAAQRPTSRRGRKKAKAALNGLGKDEAESEEERDRSGATCSTNDAVSDAGESVASSSASGGSSYSAGGRRRPGKARESSGKGRFGKVWGEEGASAAGTDVAAASAGLGAAVPRPRPPPQPPPRPGDGPDDTTGHAGSGDVASAIISELSDAESYLSLEANSCFGDSDVANELQQLSRVRVRRDRPRQHRSAGRDRSPEAAQGYVPPPRTRGSIAQRRGHEPSQPPDVGEAVAFEQTPSEASSVARRAKGLAGRLSASLGGMEERVAGRLDRLASRT